MTDLEKRMHEAFDAAHMPAGLAERTVARIEAERREREAAGLDAPGEKSTPSGAVPAARVVLDGGTSVASRRTTRVPRRRRLRVAAALAACLALLALGVAGGHWLLVPSAYVAIDVNPSLELGVNRLNRVVSTQAFNQDGQDLLDAADVRGMAYEDALTALERQLRTFLADDAAVEVTITCDDGARYATLESASKSCLDAQGTGQVHCSHATEQERADAAAAGMGLGKYRVYAALTEAGVDIAPEEAANMTMRELLALADASGVTVNGHDGAESHGAHENAHHAGNARHGARWNAGNRS